MSARNVLYRICNKVNFMYKSANRQFISVNLPIHIPIHSLSTQTQFVSPENLSDDFLYIIFRKTCKYYIKQRKYGQLCCLKYDFLWLFFVDYTQDLTLLYDELKYLLYLSVMYTLVWWGFLFTFVDGTILMHKNTYRVQHQML